MYIFWCYKCIYNLSNWRIFNILSSIQRSHDFMKYKICLGNMKNIISSKHTCMWYSLIYKIYLIVIFSHLSHFTATHPSPQRKPVSSVGAGPVWQKPHPSSQMSRPPPGLIEPGWTPKAMQNKGGWKPVNPSQPAAPAHYTPPAPVATAPVYNAPPAPVCVFF